MKYCILQIVRGGKVSRLYYRNKLQFAGKHSWLHGDLVWPNPIAQAISLEKFRGYRSIHENRETLPPRTIYSIRQLLLPEKVLTKTGISLSLSVIC